MPVILHIETATEVCSLALSEHDRLLFERVVRGEGPSHAVNLPLFVRECMNYLRENGKQLDAVAVSGGPGSYTGLRIGVSTAKGLCYGLGLPLIAIDTLQLLAYRTSKDSRSAGVSYFMPMIDARRMEVYTTRYTPDLVRQEAITPLIVDATTLSSERLPFAIAGNGAKKVAEVTTNSNMIFIEDIVPLATDMIPLALEAYNKGMFVDVAYYEPFYLKEFIATVAKPKL